MDEKGFLEFWRALNIEEQEYWFKQFKTGEQTNLSAEYMSGTDQTEITANFLRRIRETRSKIRIPGDSENL